MFESAILRIFGTGAGRPVGAGFLVGGDTALTCAHVVGAALPDGEGSRTPDAAHSDECGREPGCPCGQAVEVDLPLVSSAAPRRHRADVIHVDEAEDIAVLRVAGLPESAGRAGLVDAGDVWGHRIRAFGFPQARDDGVWHSGVLRARQSSGRVQAELAAPHGYRITRGFSGTAVWDEELTGVVGMVVRGEQRDPPAAVLIPTSRLLDAYPPLRSWAQPESPFRSLKPLQEADSALLVGREAERDALVARVRTEHVTTLTGPSGCGKSSLALAGVVPLLRASGHVAVVLRPAREPLPLWSLASALLPLVAPDAARLGEESRDAAVDRLHTDIERNGLERCLTKALRGPDAHRLLVVLDQCEEALGASSTLAPLAEALTRPGLDRHVGVLLTLRTDALDDALADPVLGALVDRCVHPLRPMSRDQLRQVVTLPVEGVPGVRYEDRLAERILADTAGVPGALPLLTHTLDLLWQKQSGGMLTHVAYEGLGGVAGALSTHADAVWNRHVPAERVPEADRLLGMLVRIPSTATDPVTRRTVLLADLTSGQRRLAEQLATTRLLVTGQGVSGRQDTVELAHEALITGWQKLRHLVDADRAFLTWYGDVRHDTERWRAAGRPAELLPGRRTLSEADRRLEGRRDDVDATVQEYLEHGRRHLRTTRRRRRTTWTVLSLVLAAALVLGTLFVQQREEAARQGAGAASRALAAAAAATEVQDPAAALTLAVAAYRTSPTRQARNALLRYYVAHRGIERILSNPPGEITTAQSSQDGSVIAVLSAGGRVTLFTGALSDTPHTVLLDGPADAMVPLVSPDGGRAGYLTQEVLVWFDVDDDGAVGLANTLPLRDAVDMGDDAGGAAAAAFSRDGTRVAVVQNGGLVWWDLAQPDEPHRITVRRRGEGTAMVWAGPDDQTFLAVAVRGLSRRIAVADIGTAEVRTLVDGVREVSPSGDGRFVVTCEEREKGALYRRLRVADGARHGSFRDTDAFGCSRVIADGDGGRFTVDGLTSLLVDVGHDRVTATAYGYGPDRGRPFRLVTSRSHSALLRFRGHAVYAVDAETALLDGVAARLVGGARMVMIGSERSTVQLRRPAGDHRMLKSADLPDTGWQGPLGLTVSPDLQTFALREAASRIVVRDSRSLRPVSRIDLPAAASQGPDDPPPVRFRYDGPRRLITRIGSEVARWEARTGRLVDRLDLSGIVPHAGDEKLTLGSHPGDDRVAITSPQDPYVHIVDLASGRMVRRHRIGEGANSAAFDDSGDHFVVVRTSRSLELWTTDPLAPRIGPLSTFDQLVPYVGGFSDDEGHYFLAAQNTVRLYDISEGTYTESYSLGGYDPDTTFRTDDPYGFYDVADKTLLYGRDAGGRTRLETLRLRPEEWADALCDITAGRELTGREQTALPVPFPDQPLCR